MKLSRDLREFVALLNSHDVDDLIVGGHPVADFTSEGRLIQRGLPPNRIALVTAISGVNFGEAWTRRVHTGLDGTPLL